MLFLESRDHFELEGLVEDARRRRISEVIQENGEGELRGPAAEVSPLETGWGMGYVLKAHGQGARSVSVQIYDGNRSAFRNAITGVLFLSVRMFHVERSVRECAQVSIDIRECGAEGSIPREGLSPSSPHPRLSRLRFHLSPQRPAQAPRVFYNTLKTLGIAWIHCGYARLVLAFTTIET